MPCTFEFLIQPSFAVLLRYVFADSVLGIPRNDKLFEYKGGMHLDCQRLLDSMTMLGLGLES